MKTCLALLLLASAPMVGSIERHDARGLRVAVEPMPEAVSVDGVDLQIQRAEGMDVPVLARRIAARWRLEGGVIRRQQQPGWQVVSRWLDGRSELVQWRGEGATAELLHSSLDLMRSSQLRHDAPFVLPPRCGWGRAIEARGTAPGFAQHSAYCRMPAAALLPLLQAELAAQGWSLGHATGPVIPMQHRAIHGQLVVTADGHEGSALVWIRLPPTRAEVR